MTTELSIREGQSAFDAKQIAALEQIGVAGASRADQAIFFHQCVRTGLDPFARQIYLIGRNVRNKKTNQWETKQTIQTGIDGFRLIARRAVDKRGETLGYADTLWCGDDGQWVDVWLKEEPPRAAKVTVLRDGNPFSAVALWREYAQTDRDGKPTSMWARMQSHMLEKCAEAGGLRKAFPQELSGMYTDDETGTELPEPGVTVDASTSGGTRRISRAPRGDTPPAGGTVDAFVVDQDHPQGDAAADVVPEPVTKPQLTKIHASYADLGIADRDARLADAGRFLGRALGSTNELTKQEAMRLLDYLDLRRDETDALFTEGGQS